MKNLTSENVVTTACIAAILNKVVDNLSTQPLDEDVKCAKIANAIIAPKDGPSE